MLKNSFKKFRIISMAENPLKKIYKNIFYSKQQLKKKFYFIHALCIISKKSNYFSLLLVLGPKTPLIGPECVNLLHILQSCCSTFQLV